ncbi:TcpD family membrane protein, partial [Bacillus thuringiensis]|nr:TcpD family membrane protein [Bacillus thuringiensis]
MILGFGLDGAYDWVKTQGKYALGIIIIGLVIFCIAKRAWGFLVTIVIAGGL